MTTKPADDGLPMPFTGRRGGAKFSRAEWGEYRARRAAHLKRFPDYDAGWQRPDSSTVFAVWNSSGLPDTKTLLPAIRLSSDERWAVSETLRQALVVMLTRVLLAGERGQMLTTNLIFDALAGAWSDHYRATIEAGRARLSYEMKAETVRASWRDLLRNGIDLAGLWHIAKSGCHGLYTTTRVPEHGYVVTLEVGSAKLSAFRDATAGYRRTALPSRILLADEPLSPRSIAQDTAGEWHYNVVAVGERSAQAMDRLEEARVFLNVPEFLNTVDHLEEESQAIQTRLLEEFKIDVTLSAQRPRGTGHRSALQWGMRHLHHRDVPAVKALVEQYRRVTGHLDQVQPVYEKVYDHASEELLEIRSGMTKSVNRRYVPRHFWPLEVTGKDHLEKGISSTYDVDGRDVEIEIMTEQTSRRGRWFRAAATTPAGSAARYYNDRGDYLDDVQPLVGFDVSASQVQILAVFLGLGDLEAQVTRRPHKELLAEVLWARSQDALDQFTLPTEPAPFDGPEDPKLRSAGKTAVMTRLYGSEAREISHKLRDAPTNFGPGLGDAHNVERLFERVGMDEVLHYFLPACQAVAERLCRQDPYQGFIFTDPYDGVRVRWNPPRITQRAVTSADTKVYVTLSVGQPNAAGDYPVDEAKLGRMILPCLIHTLDAAFAGFVVEALQARGVKDVVSVHDCWMVAADAEHELREVIREAGEPWLRSLGPVYDALCQALKGDPVFEPRVQIWKEQWTRRVAAKRWPHFLVARSVLWDRQ